MIAAAVAGGIQAAQSMGVLDPLWRETGQIANWMWPNQLPSVPEIVAAWRSGLLSDIHCRFGCLMNGALPPREVVGRDDGTARSPSARPIDFPMWEAAHKLRVGMPAVGDILELFGKGLITEERRDLAMRRLGWWDPLYRNYATLAYNNQYPSPSSLVTFALRDVWKPLIVQRYEYDAELPPEFKHFMRQLGQDGRANVDRRIHAGNPEVTWSQLYWRAHWRLPSATQAYEMYQRLRPGRMARFGADFEDVRAFTLDDLNNVLKANDYPVPFRGQLAAIAFRKPRLVDIDRYHQMGSITSAAAEQLFLDLGYSPADAKMRTEWLVKRRLKNPDSPAAKKLPEQIVKLYQLGRLTIPAARDRLSDALSGGEFRSYGLTQVDALRNADARATYAEVDRMLASADLADEIKSTQMILRAWRRQYLHGQINANDLLPDMAAAGYSDAFINRFRNQLDSELAGGRALLSTERVRRLVVQGIMPLDAATTYLQNLGWKFPEIDYLLTQLQRDLDIEQDRAAERLAKDHARREQAQLRQAAALAQRRNEVIRRMNRQASPATLRKWFIRGILDENEYDRELQRRGYDDAVRKNYLREAWIERRKYQRARRERAAASDAAREETQWGPATEPVPPA